MGMSEGIENADIALADCTLKRLEYGDLQKQHGAYQISKTENSILKHP